VIDIANYLIAQNNWTRPLHHAEALHTLAQHRVIPKRFVRRISGMVSFRNILVHRYLGIDRELVYRNLRELKDFQEFERYILHYLSRYEKKRTKPPRRAKTKRQKP
jgi:uncharacterized protein YutE (UPF0331/DUF86 family)